MGRWSKRLKKYERHILLALVIILLLTFSVTGAVQCGGGRSSDDPDYGGTFLTSPTTRGEMDHAQFVGLYDRYRPYLQWTVGTPSLQYHPGWFRIEYLKDVEGVWAHALLYESAKQVGYDCGEEQLKSQIREIVQGAMGGLEPTDATYDQFLRERYRGGVKDFQASVREVVIKDQYLRPLVDTLRYAVSYEEAYATWKQLVQRVNLGYVALRAEDFSLEARQHENTRALIAAQQKLLGELARTADTLLTVEKSVTDEEDPPATADAWGRDIRFARKEDGFDLRSAGPSGDFDTSDDVTLETVRQLRTRAGLKKMGIALERWYRALDPVMGTQTRLGELKAALQTWREANDGSWPDDVSALGEDVSEESRTDAWDNPIRYKVEGDEIRLASPGPDGVHGNDDDVTLATEAVTDIWPADLASLASVPRPGALPPLTGEMPKDAWEKDFVFERPEGEQPRLFSAGPDGEAGTPDDVLTTIEAGRVRVPLDGALIPFRTETEADAWKHALHVELESAILSDVATWQWSVRSAGPDGEFGTADDITSGNDGELRSLFRQIRGEFVEPTKRRYEAVWAHMPLVPDDALRALMKAHPDLAPEEMKAFAQWRLRHRDTYYLQDDPGHETEGYGIELATRLAPDAKPTLVPDASLFGEVPESVTEEADPDDLKTYVDKGWRPIVLRELFFENIVLHILTRAVESQTAHEEWKKKVEAHEAAPDEVEHPGDEPAVEEFEALLADVLGDVSPELPEGPAWIGLHRSETPLTMSEWEALDHIGDINLTLNTQQVKGEGEYLLNTQVYHDNQTRAAVRNLEYFPERRQEFEEVYDDVFARFIDHQSLELAAGKLEELRASYLEENTPKSGADPEAVEAGFQKALAAWSAGLATAGAEAVDDATGWFIGAQPPRRPENFDDPGIVDPVQEMRRTFVRETGFSSIQAATPGELELVPGTVGSTVFRDSDATGTQSAYLIRLLDAREPPPEAFSPRDYADYVMSEIRGGPKGGYRLGAASGLQMVDGSLKTSMERYFADWGWLTKNFELAIDPRVPLSNQREKDAP